MYHGLMRGRAVDAVVVVGSLAVVGRRTWLDWSFFSRRFGTPAAISLTVVSVMASIGVAVVVYVLLDRLLRRRCRSSSPSVEQQR